MTDETLEFVLPMPPNRANARGHWRAIHNAKKAYWETLDMLQQITGAIGMSLADPARTYVPKPPRTPWPAASVKVTYHMCGTLMDEDNAVARFKWIGDWLTTRGYVVDDDKTALQWAGFPRQVSGKRSDVRVEVTLTKRAPSEAAA